MSFSAEIKKELSELNNLKNKEEIKAELSGYMLGINYSEVNGISKIITENTFNIDRLIKILENLKIQCSDETKGKTFIVKWSNKNRESIMDVDVENQELQKAVVRGAFMASGSLNNPNKKYHLEIIFPSKENAKYIMYILDNYFISSKILKREKGYAVYIKDGEEISKFLALIGANKAVMDYEEIRVIRQMRSSVNRIVNCETANINKTINVAIEQIADINYLKENKKFEELSKPLQEIANVRLENPEASLVELGKLLDKPIGKSGVNHRLKKIQEFARELKEN
ncbi:MAG: DNA-binding protein WhiA [Clostridia bacterium]|nr:DNA-binding protein WhiA [Clostridia bacterium]